MGQSKKRHYWLGSDVVSAQDTFFLEALDSNIWSAGTRDQWDSCWNISMPERSMFKQLDATKTLNHIPGNSALTIKSNLHKTLTKAKQRVSGLPQEQRYSFYPDTYSMPEDYFKFQAVAAENPDWLWIQKPKNLSRGRGIEVVKHPEMVPMNSEWIIQRYLSEPHLWDGYKYVLRCYVVITSVEPLRFYWFHEGFAKLTSEPYSNEDLDNPYRHLTNPDINEDNTDVDIPVVFHSFKTYRQWLKDQGADDEKLFAEIHDLIALTVISARESMRTQSQKVDADTQGAYELIGLDCMVDNDLKPWILECNLSPSLETCSTSDEKGKEEAEIKRQLVQDIVNMLGLNDLDKSNDLNEQQKAAYELERAGGFQCVFPTEKANDYFNCFPVPRYADIASLPAGTEIDHSKIPLQAPEGIEAIFADSLALLYGRGSGDKQHFIFPNELATLIWLQNSSGMTPQQIAAELVTAYGDEESNDNNRLNDIWDVLADWSQANLFVTNDHSVCAIDKALSNEDVGWVKTQELTLAGVNAIVRSACPIAGAYIESFFKAYAPKGEQDSVITLDILRSQYGYVLISGTDVIAGSQKLSMLIPKLLGVVAKHCLKDDDIAIVQGVVVSISDRNILIISNSSQLDTWSNELVNSHADAKLLSGTPILDANQRTVRCTDFPLFLLDSQLSSQLNSKSMPDNGDEPLVIAEKSGEAYQLHAIDAQMNDKVTIDNVLFLHTVDDDSTDEPIQVLRNAEVLAQLWESCIQKQNLATSLLPTWLESVQGIQVMVQGNSQASLMSALEVLMSS